MNIEDVHFSGAETAEELKKVYFRHPKHFAKVFGNLLEKGINRIGEGNAATVLFIGHSPTYCVKIFKKELGPEAIQIPIEQEFEIQARASRVGKGFVPAVSCMIETEDPDDHEMMIMERVPGVSIKDIIDGEAQLPEGFNYIEFFNELKKQIELLHENKIYHRDLHEGNVMIDSQTGKPWIIDFGAADITFGSDDEEIYNYSTVGNVTRRLLNDDNAVNRLRKLLMPYLTRSV